MRHDGGMDDYLEVNRLNWDERAPAHAASPDYGFDRFVADPEHLSGVVRFDLPLLGDVTGLTGIHLQCHIGTDTLSLARLGARMTGLDLSPASLEQARRLAAEAGPAGRLRRGRYVLRAAGPRRAHVRPRLHRHRRAVLAARHRPVGGGRRRPPRAGRTALPARGAPDDVGGRRPAHRRAQPGLRLLRDPRALGRGGARHLRRDRHRVRQQPRDLVEPRPRRDRDRPAIARVRGHRPRRAPQRAVGRAARPDDRRRRPRRVVARPSTATGCRSATRCRPASPDTGRVRRGPSASRSRKRSASTTTRSTVPRPTTVPPASVASTVEATRGGRRRRSTSARTVTSRPRRSVRGGRGARTCRRWSRRRRATASRARQVASSHQARRRGVPSTGRLPEPRADAVSASPTTLGHLGPRPGHPTCQSHGRHRMPVRPIRNGPTTGRVTVGDTRPTRRSRAWDAHAGPARSPPPRPTVAAVSRLPVRRWERSAGASSRARPRWRAGSSAAPFDDSPDDNGIYGAGPRRADRRRRARRQQRRGRGGRRAPRDGRRDHRERRLGAHRPPRAAHEPRRRGRRVQRPRAPARQRARGRAAARRRAHHGRRQRRDPPHRARRRRCAQLEQTVRRIRALGSEVVVGTCPDLGTIQPIQQPLRSLMKRWSRDLAAAQTVAVVEAGGRTVSLGDLIGPEFDESPHEMFSKDRFHPSAAGYARAAAALLPSVCAALGVWGADTTDRAARAAAWRGRGAGRRGGRPGGQGPGHRGRADRDRGPVAGPARPLGRAAAAPPRRRAAGRGHPRASRRMPWTRREGTRGPGLTAPSTAEPSASHRNGTGAKVKRSAPGGKVGATRRRGRRARPRPSTRLSMRPATSTIVLAGRI